MEQMEDGEEYSKVIDQAQLASGQQLPCLVISPMTPLIISVNLCPN